MKLLEVEKVKDEKKQSDQDRIKRVAKLNEEESMIVRRINQLHENEKKEKELMQNNLIQLQKNAKKEKEKIKQEMVSLFKEVDKLEKRKLEALKPIEDVQIQVENALKQAKTTLTALESRKMELDAFHEKNLDLTEKLQDKSNDLDIREKEIILKENRINAETKRLKDGVNKLSEEWADFHKKVNEANREIIRREKEVEAGSRTNENFKMTLDKKEKEQAEHDRQIADRYGTLGRAIEEAKKKYGVNL